jgi:hypothetical protein
MRGSISLACSQFLPGSSFRPHDHTIFAVADSSICAVKWGIVHHAQIKEIAECPDHRKVFCKMPTLLFRLGALVFLPIGQLFVFERHTFQFISYLRRCRKLRLLTAQQLERPIGKVGKGPIHRAKLMLRARGAFTCDKRPYESSAPGMALASCGQRMCREFRGPEERKRQDD